MKGDQPAFPLTFIDREGCTGMSTRLYIAVEMMKALLSRDDSRTWDSGSPMTFGEWQRQIFDEDAKTAYVAADALIAAENERE